MSLKKKLFKKGFMRSVIKYLIDIVLVVVAYLLAFALRFDGKILPEYREMYFTTLPIVVVIYGGLLVIFGLYRGIWKYASVRDLGLILVINSIGVLSLFIIFWGFWPIYIPRGVLAIFWFLIIFALGGVRMAYRIYSVYWPSVEKQRKKVLIVGAGNSGEMIVRQMLQDRQLFYKPVGFVDDNSSIHGNRIHGFPVLGSSEDIPGIVRKKNVAEIILAIPSATAAQMRQVVDYCEQAGVPFKTLPGPKEMMDGKVSLSKIRPVKIEDLLERVPYTGNAMALGRYFKGRTIVVTGAAGSIGSELCRQLMKLQPQSLILFDQAESDLFDLDHEIRRDHDGIPNVVPVVGDINRIEKLQSVFKQYPPHIVFHAAAYKHVPMMEAFPEEAVRNNVFGTITVSQAAAEAGAERFVLISTDKAVNPVSVMGATKRVSELYCISQNGHQPMKHVVVRFGNVLASKGSVVPLFQQQIRLGGPVTVTSKEMTRYFMTIPEAVELVLQASVLGSGGEIFVLDMGEPINVYEMARHLITLSGFKPDEDVKIVITGLRPGEKLHEELWSGEEQPEPTEQAKILRVSNTLARANNFNRSNLEKLRKAMEGGDPTQIRRMLETIVPSARLR